MSFFHQKNQNAKLKVSKVTAILLCLILLVSLISFSAYFNLVFKQFYIDSIRYEQDHTKNHLEMMQTTIPKLTIQILSESAITKILSGHATDSVATKTAIEFMKNIEFYHDISQILICEPETDALWADASMQPLSLSAEIARQPEIGQLLTAFHQGKNYLPSYDKANDSYDIAYLHQDYRGYILIYTFPRADVLSYLKNEDESRARKMWVYYKNDHLVLSSTPHDIKSDDSFIQRLEKEEPSFLYHAQLYVSQSAGNLQCITAVPYQSVVAEGFRTSSFLILPIVLVVVLVFLGYLWISGLYQKTITKHRNAIDIVQGDIDFLRLKQIIIRLFSTKPADKDDLSRLQKAFPQPYHRILALQLDMTKSRDTDTASDDISLMKYGVCNISCELANTFGKCLSFDIDDDFAVLILNTKEPIDEETLLQMIQKIKALSAEIYHLTLTVTISQQLQSMAELSAGIADISELSHYRYVTGYDSIITPKNASETVFGEKLPKIYHKQLSEAVKLQDFAHMERLLQEFRMFANDCTPVSVRNELLQLFLHILQNTNETALSSRNYEILLGCQTFTEAMDFFAELLLKQTDIGPAEEFDFAELVKNLTAENYSNPDYHIGYLADKLQISISYAGKRFKNTFGCSFNSYLMEYRVEMAASLLKNTNIKISEIAAKCGFNSDTYFVTSFKKLKNITPHGYRSKKDS